MTRRQATPGPGGLTRIQTELLTEDRERATAFRERSAPAGRGFVDFPRLVDKIAAGRGRGRGKGLAVRRRMLSAICPQRTRVVMFGVLAMLLGRPPASEGQSADELAKQTQNPVASLISVPFQGNWDFGLGDRDATSTLLNFQPVMPFGITKSTNLILRVIMPLTSQPGPDGERINGLSDIVATAFFSPANSGRLIWGVGPVVLLPAAINNALGSEHFGVGPSAVALIQPGKWTIGALFNQIWSTSGANDRDDVSTMFLQPFANYSLGGGLSTGVTIEATANWEANETWTAPLLFNLSKVTLLGKRPVSFAVAAGPTLAIPDAGASWRFRLAATFLFPR